MHEPSVWYTTIVNIGPDVFCLLICGTPVISYEHTQGKASYESKRKSKQKITYKQVAEKRDDFPFLLCSVPAASM